MFELKNLFTDLEQSHSEYQQDNFITKFNGITLYGQYKQSLRELKVRYTNLKNFICDIELINLDISDINNKLVKLSSDSYEYKKYNIELLKKNFVLDDMIINYKDIKSEFIRFYKQSCVLKELILKKHHIDGNIITEQIKIESEKDYWLTKFKLDSILSLKEQNRLSHDLYKTILFLPKEDKKDVLKLIETSDKKALIDYMNNITEDMQNTFNEESLNKINTDNILQNIKLLETNIISNESLLLNK